MYPVRYLLLATTSVFVFITVACGGGGGPEATPSPAVARRSPTPSPSPSPIPKPDPQTLLQPGYVLDQALEVNLDGSGTGQIAVISHTNNQFYYCSSSPAPTPTPKSFNCDAPAIPVAPKQGCPTDPMLEVDPSACVFRFEIFSHDPASGWTSKYATGKHRGGIEGGMELSTFTVDDQRKAIVLSAGYCTGVGSGCGLVHEVLTMVAGEVKLVGGGWQALVNVEATRVSISNPAYFGDDPFCCPSARRSATIALDPMTGELGVIATELVACKEGELVGLPEPPRNTVQLRGCGSFEVTDQTVVEPASIGGIQGLRVGETVRIEYGVGQCPDDGIPYNCSWGEVLAATKITVLNP